MEVTDERNGDLLEHADVIVPLYLLQHVWDTDSRGNVFKNTPYVKVVQCDNSLWRNSSVMLLLPLYPSNHNTLLQPAVCAPRGGLHYQRCGKKSQKRTEEVLKTKECHVTWEDTTFTRVITTSLSSSWRVKQVKALEMISGWTGAAAPIWASRRCSCNCGRSSLVKESIRELIEKKRWGMRRC